MSKNYIGAKRKRTNTPAAARKRAVEYRHRPYIVKKAAVKAAEEVTELKDLILAEEAEPEIPAPAEEVPEEPAAEKQADTTVPSDSGAAAAAAGAAAAGGFFARAMKSIKGLFSRKEAAKEDTSLVSDVKTWLNSPIDPDAEEEPAETAEAAETGLTEAAEEAEIAVAAGEPEEVSETEEATEETAAAEEVLETAEETAEEEPSESEETPAEETPSEEPEENVTEESAEADAEAEEVAAEEATDQEAEEISLAAEEETEESAETSEEETPAEETEEPSEEPASSEAAEEEPAASEAAEEETAEEAAETEVPAEEVTQPEESEEDIFAEVQEETEEPQPEPEPEPELTKKEKKELKKAIRKETRIQLLDEKIDSPRAGLFSMLLLPGRAMTRVASVEKTTLSAPSVLILNLIKWAAVGTFFAMFIEKFINIFNFSFIRLNFTGTAGLAFRFGIFGLAAEYLSYIIIGLFCGLIRKKISTLKLMEVESRSALAVALLFAAGCVLVWKDMLAFAVTAAAAGMVIGFITKGYGMDLVLTIGKNTQLVLVLILVVCACLAGFRYFPLTVSGLMDIFRTILHL